MLHIWKRYKLIQSNKFSENNVDHTTFNPLTTNVFHYIETSQLICIANQLTVFYMMGNTGR